MHLSGLYVYPSLPICVVECWWLRIAVHACACSTALMFWPLEAVIHQCRCVHVCWLFGRSVRAWCVRGAVVGCVCDAAAGCTQVCAGPYMSRCSQCIYIYVLQCSGIVLGCVHSVVVRAWSVVLSSFFCLCAQLTVHSVLLGLSVLWMPPVSCRGKARLCLLTCTSYSVDVYCFLVEGWCTVPVLLHCIFCTHTP